MFRIEKRKDGNEFIVFKGKIALASFIHLDDAESYIEYKKF